MFLQSTAALNYTALKTELVNEFDTAVSCRDVYTMFGQRKWKKRGKSLHCYVLSMQAIAKRADIGEMEVINFIIDGMGSDIPNINCSWLLAKLTTSKN